MKNQFAVLPPRPPPGTKPLDIPPCPPSCACACGVLVAAPGLPGHVYYGAAPGTRLEAPDETLPPEQWPRPPLGWFAQCNACLRKQRGWTLLREIPLLILGLVVTVCLPIAAWSLRARLGPALAFCPAAGLMALTFVSAKATWRMFREVEMTLWQMAPGPASGNSTTGG